MDSLLAAINEYRIVLGAIVLTLVAVFLVKKFWDQVSFYVLRVRMNMPLFGKLSRLSKQPGRDKAGWFNAEKDVCSEFQPYFEEVNKSSQFYDNCKNYLAKVDELGRKKLGILGWVVISVMVFIEAMGFSYVLSGFTIPGASEALKQQGAIGIALLISGLLVFLTHWCGAELHHNSLIKKVRIWWAQSDTSEQMKPNQKVTLEKDYFDDADPEWRNLLSRIKANANVKPSYFVTVVTIIAVLCIGSGATFVRIQVLNAELIGAHDSGQYEGASMNGTSASSDPYAIELPAELVASQAETDTTSDDQIMNANLKGGMTTFMVLAVVFVFLQIVGVLLGLKTGFAGKESADAHKFSGRFKNREEFTVYHERKRNVIAQIAQRNLTKLQSKMTEKLPQSTTDKSVLDTLGQGNNRTFLSYAQSERKKHGEYHVESSFERRDRDALMASAQQTPSTPATASVDKHESSPASLAENNDHGLSEYDIQAWMSKLGWGRDRTIDLLLKQRERNQQEQKTEVSEEEALRMMNESTQ